MPYHITKVSKPDLVQTSYVYTVFQTHLTMLFSGLWF